MRKFWVKNARGQVFDMNREDAFFSNPKGLGTARKTTYDQKGYIWVERESILNQKKPSGNMVFDGYEQYEEFRAIIQYTPLTLMYQPLQEVYYLDVNIYTLELGEISYRDGFLTCKVTFDGKTPWYKKKKVYRKESAEQGKVYSYTYPYLYVDTSSGETEIENESAKEAYCRLTFYGPITEPTWNLVQGERQLANGRVLADIEEGCCLVVDSDPRKYEIAKYDELGNYLEDLYGKSDFDTKRFLEIPPGQSKIKVSHAGTAEIRFHAEVMEFAG